MAKGARQKCRYADVGTLALGGTDGKARKRQLAVIEFGVAEGAEEDFLRAQGHDHGVYPIDRNAPVNQRAGAVVIADGDGKLEFGHGLKGSLATRRERHSSTAGGHKQMRAASARRSPQVRTPANGKASHELERGNPATFRLAGRRPNVGATGAAFLLLATALPCTQIPLGPSSSSLTCRSPFFPEAAWRCPGAMRSFPSSTE